jgi:hypothetical protein
MQTTAQAMNQYDGASWYGVYDDGSSTIIWGGYKTVAYAPNLYFNGQGSTKSNQSLKSQHTGGFHGLLADGSTRFISDNINLTTLYYLADIADNNVVGDF